jgi:hypothetical protein
VNEKIDLKKLHLSLFQKKIQKKYKFFKIFFKIYKGKIIILTLSREKFDTNTLQTQNTRWGREMGITWKWNEEDHWRWVTSSHFTHPFYFYSYSKIFKRHARARVCSESPPLALWFFHFIVVTHPFLKTQFLDTLSLSSSLRWTLTRNNVSSSTIQRLSTYISGFSFFLLKKRMVPLVLLLKNGWSESCWLCCTLVLSMVYTPTFYHTSMTPVVPVTRVVLCS